MPRRRLGTRLWQKIVLYALIASTGSVGKLSYAATMRRGVSLGRLAYRVARRQRRFAVRNLRLAYGDAMTAAEREGMTLRVFEQMGKNVLDFLRVSTLDDAQMGKLVAAVEGREYLDSVCARGSGFVIVTGHIGNFEFLGGWLATQGVASTGVAREPADPALAAYLRRIRERRGNSVLSKGTSARELISRLRKGAIITLGVDQNSGDVFVPFFGVPAGTVTGPARLALRTGVPILPAFCVRDPDDRYRILFSPPLFPDKTADREGEVIRLTEEINQILEGIVRRWPDQWLWLHDRWRAAFEEKNIPRWPPGYDFPAALRRWQGE